MTRTLIAVSFLLIFTVAPAQALCVTDGQGPCYRFWKVDAVFVAKVLDMVPVVPPDAPPLLPGTIRIGDNYRLQIRVAEAFRGVKAGAVMTLFAPDGVCGGVNARNGGELFIYASRNGAGELWAHGCGESKPLENADADLAYARSVSAVGPSAVIYGEVVNREDRTGGPEDFSEMAGVNVRVYGEGFDAHTTTDDDGNYSLNLPGAGSYTVEVIPPKGFADRHGNGKVRFDIGDRRSCYSVAFQLRRNGRIRGRVIDRDGQPVSHLTVRAGDSQGFSKTDDSGHFDIGPLGAGLYSLAARIGRASELKFENSALVEVELGKVTELPSLIVGSTTDLVLVSVDVDGPHADEALIVLTSSRTRDDMSDAVSAASRPVRFLVGKDELFEVEAATLTHSAKATVRSGPPETRITLTLRRSPEQR